MNGTKWIYGNFFSSKFIDNSESAHTNRRGRKKQAAEAIENIESTSSKRKLSRRQDESREATAEIASSVKTASSNKLKRQKSSRAHNQLESIEISSEDEAPIETKVRNCIASRTRSKAHHSSPSPSKRPKLVSRTSSISPGVENNAATLGSNIRKTSTRHHNTESASTSASRRTPISVLATTTSETNSVNNNVRPTTPSTFYQFDNLPKSINLVNSKTNVRTHFQVSQSANPANLLRRSSRSKVQQSTVTTGSCVSSAASTQACSYQIRSPSSSANDAGGASGSSSAFASHSGHTSSSTNSSTNNSTRRRRKSATFITSVGKLHDTANNQVLVEASTSGMANDGSRDANTHNQSQNLYGKASKKFSLKLHRMTFTSADSNSSSSTQTNESTDMSNIHSLRRSPRGSVKTNNLSSSANVHTSPLAVNASSTAISIATAK